MSDITPEQVKKLKTWLKFAQANTYLPDEEDVSARAYLLAFLDDYAAMRAALSDLVEQFDAYRNDWQGPDVWRDRIGLRGDLDRARAALGEKK